jgi:F0F1-type ATP synthase membrane subunit c/vacuolar-type H+-ATPase subunit K
MHHPRIKQRLLVFSCILFFLGSAVTTHAQFDKGVQGTATLGVARMVDTNEKNIKDGSIISSSSKGAIQSNLAYDPQVLGVVSRDAAILIDTGESDKGVPVISSGKVYMLVSTKNGAIKKGDLLATSTMPGVGVKAALSGYVLGTALEDAASPDPKHIEKIAVDLDLHYFNSKPTFPGSLTDIFKYALLPTKDAPTPIFKYIVAAGVVLASLLLGFLSFGRTAAKGVEALGRNPAASRIIHLGIIFNIVIVVVIVFAGLTVSFLILRL